MINQLLILAQQARRLSMTPVVDDDFPEVNHNFSSALHNTVISDAFNHSGERLRDTTMFPEVVCLCGSTRFKDEFIQRNFEETMRGNIVLTVGFFTHADSHVHAPTLEEKEALDRLHKRKIELADRVVVINPNDYIGDSTRSEIEHALAWGKPIEYTHLHTTLDSKETARG